MTTTEESQVIARLGQLEEAIGRRFTELDAKLSSALLEQERRNSTFATRDRLDELARKSDDVSGAFNTRTQHFLAIEQVQREQGVAIATLSTQISASSLDRMRAGLGFLASLLALILTAIVTFVLAHGIH